MNHSRSNDAKSDRIATGLKTAMLICTLGFIVLIADHALFTLSEPSPRTTTLLMPSVAAPLATDRRFEGSAPRVVTPASSDVGRAALAPEARVYPEPGGDAVRDEDGHPPSF